MKLQRLFLLPAVLLVCRPDMIRDFRRTVGEQLGLYALIIVVSAATFLQVRFPIALLIFPALALLCFRLGPRGAAVAALIMAVALSSMVVVLPSPPNLAGWSLTEKTRSLQFLIAVAFLTSLATAMAIADQKRMKRLWAGRTRVARCAIA